MASLAQAGVNTGITGTDALFNPGALTFAEGGIWIYAQAVAAITISRACIIEGTVAAAMDGRL